MCGFSNRRRLFLDALRFYPNPCHGGCNFLLPDFSVFVFSRQNRRRTAIRRRTQGVAAGFLSFFRGKNRAARRNDGAGVQCPYRAGKGGPPRGDSRAGCGGIYRPCSSVAAQPPLKHRWRDSGVHDPNAGNAYGIRRFLNTPRHQEAFFGRVCGRC